jgi:putative flippase GtrA
MRRFLRYAAAGALGTCAHYAVFLTALALAPAAVVAGSTAGAVVGAGANYWLNYRYSFASRRPHRQAVARFALVAGAGLTLNALLMGALTTAAVAAIPAQLVATAIVLVTGYLLNRHWTFAWRTR